MAKEGEGIGVVLLGEHGSLITNLVENILMGGRGVGERGEGVREGRIRGRVRRREGRGGGRNKVERVGSNENGKEGGERGRGCKE